MLEKKLLLREFAGQCCDVQINWRTNDSCYVTFLTQKGYGDPVLEKEKLLYLLRCIEHQIE